MRTRGELDEGGCRVGSCPGVCRRETKRELFTCKWGALRKKKNEPKECGKTLQRIRDHSAVCHQRKNPRNILEEKGKEGTTGPQIQGVGQKKLTCAGAKIDYQDKKQQRGKEDRDSKRVAGDVREGFGGEGCVSRLLDLGGNLREGL